MKYFILILLLLIPTATINQVNKLDLYFVGQMQLFITDEGFFIVKYNGIVSPCFTKKYFDFYYDCEKFDVDEYLKELKKYLQDTNNVPNIPTKEIRKTYRI